jgi:lysophospholipase L1-like esterase
VSAFLLGDSHLERIQRDLPLLGPDVTNLAVGGSVVTDLADQVRDVEIPDDARLVVSIGTNDAAPASRVSLPDLGAAMDAFVASLPGRTWVYVASPGCVEDLAAHLSSATLARYSARAAQPVRAAGGAVVDTPALLAPVGRAAFTEDGFHLTGSGYAILIDALAAALA